MTKNSSPKDGILGLTKLMRKHFAPAMSFVSDIKDNIWVTSISSFSNYFFD